MQIRIFIQISIINNPIAMQMTKRQFMQIYDQSVSTIRQIKNSNDMLNKNIGVTNEVSLLHELEADQENIQNLYQKINGLIEKMEQSYLDPDTARKIGTVKQQLRIQKDRRNQISARIHEATKNMPLLPKESKPKKMIEEPPEDLNIGRSSQLTDLETNQSKQSQMVEINDFDYEMERKLIHEKNSVLGQTQQKLIHINHLALQTSNMVHYQGQQLDIIGDDMLSSYKNMQLTNDELSEAAKQQKKGRKKCICSLLIVLGLVGLVLTFIFLL